MNKNVIKGDELNCKSISVKNNNIFFNNKSIAIQTPKMRLPWNISCQQYDFKDKYSITLSFKGMENDDELLQFYKNIQEIDKFILKYIIKNKLELFNKEINSELIKKSYMPLIKVSVDKETLKPNNKYPPTIKINLPYRNNRFDTRVFDAKKTEIDLKKIPIVSILVKELETKILLQLSNIWIMGNKSGCSLNAIQIKLTENEKKIKNYSFIENNSDESDDEYDVYTDDEDNSGNEDNSEIEDNSENEEYY